MKFDKGMPKIMWIEIEVIWMENAIQAELSNNSWCISIS